MSVTFNSLNLHANIGKALEICGYTIPTPIQAKSIPEILNGKDVAASAQTGTGKTAAFVLPALNKLLEKKSTNRKPRILVLTPTRELASQINKAANMYGKFCQFNIISLLGGMPYGNQIKDLARGADIIVATPGRLMDHMEQKRVDLSSIEMLVLDEADRMLDMGFIDDVQFIAKFTPQARQTLLFSATLDNRLMSEVRQLLKSPVRIDLSSEKLAAPSIKQEMYKAQNLQHKNKLLKHFLSDNSIYKAIIFTATKINADKLADQLRYDGFPAAALHGDLRQNVRNRTVEQLRRGKIQFLVATDVAARGIDISDVTHVINYDMPRFCEDYVHRIGRTGRAGKTGVAISFVLSTEMKHLQKIERYIGQRLNLKMISNADLDVSIANAPQREFEVIEEPEERNFGGRGERRGGHGGKRSFKSFDKEKDGARAGYAMRRESKHGESHDRNHDVTRKPRYDHEGEYRTANFAKDRKPKRQFDSFDRDGSPRRRDDAAPFGQERTSRRESFQKDGFADRKPKRQFDSSARDGSPKRRDGSAPFGDDRAPRRDSFKKDGSADKKGKRQFDSFNKDGFSSRSDKQPKKADGLVRDRKDSKEGRFGKKSSFGSKKPRFAASETFSKDKKFKRRPEKNA